MLGFDYLTIAFKAVLLAASAWWCLEIFKRFPKDLEELRGDTRPEDKRVIVFFWVVTLIPLGYCVSVLIALVTPLM